jgi:hypothetical protein
LWYAVSNASIIAIGYAKFYSRSHDAFIRVYNAAGKMIETHEQPGEFKEPGADARKTLCLICAMLGCAAVTPSAAAMSHALTFFACNSAFDALCLGFGVALAVCGGSVLGCGTRVGLQPPRQNSVRHRG